MRFSTAENCVKLMLKNHELHVEMNQFLYIIELSAPF